MDAVLAAYVPGARRKDMLVTSLLFAVSAFAEDSTFAGTKPPDDPPEGTDTHLTAEFGGTYTSGNSAFYAVSAIVKADHLWKVRNKISGNVGFQFGGSKSDDDGDGFLNEDERDNPLEEDVRRIAGELRYDRYLSDHDALYALAGAFHDPWAGYDYRIHEQLGYSRLLVKTEDTQFRSEIGIDYAQEDYIDAIEPNYQDVLAARILLGLDHKFNEHVGFSETFEVYESLFDFEDVRVLNNASLTTNVSTVLSVKLSHVLTYDNVPVTGFAKLDQTAMATLVATIL